MKKLSVNKIVNELEGSAFFPSRKKSSATSVPPQDTGAGDGREANSFQYQPERQMPERAFGRSGEREQKRRIITRNSFEIYEDQMEALRRLSFQEKMEGKVGSMSAMVREAIDSYIKSHA